MFTKEPYQEIVLGSMKEKILIGIMNLITRRIHIIFEYDKYDTSFQSTKSCSETVPDKIVLSEKKNIFIGRYQTDTD